MKDRPRAYCLFHAFFLLAAAPGCQALHAYRPVTVQIVDAETKKPVSGAEVRLSYPLVHPADAPWQSVGTSNSDGAVQLRAAPYGEAGVLVEATLAGYMTEQKNFPTDAVNAIPTTGFFKSAGQRPVDFVVEMYAEPFPAIELVLPNHYRGIVKVAVKIQEDAPFERGQRVFSYNVPPSGVVQVVGPALLRRVFAPDYNARYVDGTPIPREPKDGEIGFLCLKTEGGFDHYVVGTKAEFEALRQSDQSDSGKQQKSAGGGKSGGRGRGKHNGGSTPPADNSDQASLSPG